MRALVLLAYLAACADSDVSRAVGARCDETSECDDRCLAPSTDYPAGFCTVDCSTSDDCTSNSACVDRDGGVCLFTCAADPGCAFLGAGWRCKESDLRGTARKVMVCRGD